MIMILIPSYNGPVFVRAVPTASEAANAGFCRIPRRPKISAATPSAVRDPRAVCREFVESLIGGARTEVQELIRVRLLPTFELFVEDGKRSTQATRGTSARRPRARSTNARTGNPEPAMTTGRGACDSYPSSRPRTACRSAPRAAIRPSKNGARANVDGFPFGRGKAVIKGTRHRSVFIQRSVRIDRVAVAADKGGPGLAIVGVAFRISRGSFETPYLADLVVGQQCQRTCFGVTTIEIRFAEVCLRPDELIVRRGGFCSRH